jgi:hypothetical protein
MGIFLQEISIFGVRKPPKKFSFWAIFGNELAKKKRTTLDIVTLFEWGNESVEVPLAHPSWCALGGWGEEAA